MSTAQQTQAWDHTAAMMALIINAFKEKSKSPITVDDINPYRDKQHPKTNRLPFGHLKELLDGNGRGN